MTRSPREAMIPLPAKAAVSPPISSSPLPVASARVAAHAEENQPARRRRRRRKKKVSSHGTSGDTPQKHAPRDEEPWDSASFDVPPKEGHVRFHDLDVPDELMRAIDALGFRYCTPIQGAILPHTIAGKDATGRAQTGTGKTAAFLITILCHFLRHPRRGTMHPGTPRALIMAPTRELVMQIEKDAQALSRYVPCNAMAVYGGTAYKKQLDILSTRTIDIIAATPGRLIDYAQQKKVHLNEVEILVIDEADRMLDMGFIPDMRRIVRSTPPREKRQTLLFSATLSNDVLRLANQWTHEPVKIEIEPDQRAVDTVEQKTYIVTKDQKFPMVWNIITQLDLQRVLIFCNRRDTARILSDRLARRDITCAVLSGDIAQNKRTSTLEAFRSGRIRVLVATDVAARGIHIDEISHVINYNMPEDPESYVHRIGRTGRAGAEGIAISFACEEDGFLIPQLEKFLGEKLVCEYPPEDLLTPAPAASRRSESPRGRNSRRAGSRQSGSRKGGSRQGGSRQSGPRRRKRSPRTDGK